MKWGGCPFTKWHNFVTSTHLGESYLQVHFGPLDGGDAQDPGLGNDWHPTKFKELELAAMWGDKALVHFLPEKGAGVEAKDSSGWTALPPEKAGVEIKDSDGRAALYRVSSNRHGAVVKLFLEKDAGAEAKNKFGRTALHEASLSGHETMVKLLLEEGDNTGIKDSSNTALHRAPSSGHEEVVKLLKKRANIGRRIHLDTQLSEGHPRADARS